ncbi:MAG: TatD family hydrolase [Alphaproteobacteria bacterium]|nr:TatD family hydrolase [Alphaproteobacteria bacterium]
MLIDTHCHLTYDFSSVGGVVAVIKRATTAGVKYIICPTANPVDILPAIKLSHEYDNIFTTIGIHPEYAGTNPANYITDEILSDPRVLGIGEIGLDYHEMENNTRNAQIELFEKQLEMARRAKLPVAIHTREAENDTVEILSQYSDVVGVMHCFTSSYDMAKKMLDCGYYFSASGILTFKNAGDIRETFARIPLDRLVVETDSPYCAPVPHRGSICEPAYVIDTARVLAEIKNISFEKMCETVMENIKKLYPKIQF